MSDITISTSDGKEEPKIQEHDIKKALDTADEYQKLKEKNDRFEEELRRQEELKARMSIAGRAAAGQQVHEVTQSEKDEAEAKRILSMIQ